MLPASVTKEPEGGRSRRCFVLWRQRPHPPTPHPSPGLGASGVAWTGNSCHLIQCNTTHSSCALVHSEMCPKELARVSELPSIPKSRRPTVPGPVLSPTWNSKQCHLGYSIAKSEDSSHCPWPSDVPLLPEDSNHQKPSFQGNL